MENKSKRSNRLGRGLSALIPEIKGETSEKEIVNMVEHLRQDIKIQRFK